MLEVETRFNVRKINGKVSVVDIQGEITSAAEKALFQAYGAAISDGESVVVLNFSELEYMNSSGIGLLVTLLIRAQREQRRLLAFSLSDHYRQIFAITRLNEMIGVYPSEGDALAAVDV